MTERRIRHAFLLLLVVAITVIFLTMIRAFVLTILLAAIGASLSYPIYRWCLRHLRGHAMPAALATLALVVLVVLAPLLFVLGAGANEALRVAQTLGPLLARLVDQPGELDVRLRAVPGYGLVAPFRSQILATAGDLLGNTSAFMFATLSATTQAGAVLVFQATVLLYTMYFFLIDGPGLLRTVLGYVPLPEADTERMVERFMSVTRATLKGSMVIGLAQGALGGLAFWAVGLDGAVFWGMVMTVVSIIPGIGAPLVWVPAAVVLLVTGHLWRGLVLVALCGLVVGSVDNLLRARLVGRDAAMHELLIFFSTLGGLMLFGAMGVILGPVLAALFVAAWDMFGVAFRRNPTH